MRPCAAFLYLRLWPFVPDCGLRLWPSRMPSTIGFSHSPSCVELGNAISYALRIEGDLLLYLGASISCSPHCKELRARFLGAWGIIFDPMLQMFFCTWDRVR